MTNKKMKLTKTGLDYFPIDVDWLSDPKLSRLLARHGSRGVGILIRLLCNLYRSGYCLPWDKDAVEGFSWETRESTDVVREVVDILLSSGFFDRRLAQSSTPVLTSAGIQRRYLNVTSRRVNRAIPAHLDLLLGEREDSLENDLRASCMQTADSMSTVCQHDVDSMSAVCKQPVDSMSQDVYRGKKQVDLSFGKVESSLVVEKASVDSMSAGCQQDGDSLSRKASQRKGKEREGKENKEKEELTFPSSLDTPEHREAFEDWLDYKRKRKASLIVKSQNQLLRQWAEKPDRFIGAIRHSIANGYQGVFEPKEDPNRAAETRVGLSKKEERALAVVRSFKAAEVQS